jgi:hypothetical protein
MKTDSNLSASMCWAFIRFSRDRDLLRYCRDNVLLRDSGKRPQPGSPDDKTVREAITKHGLGFFVDKA